MLPRDQPPRSVSDLGSGPAWRPTGLSPVSKQLHGWISRFRISFAPQTKSAGGGRREHLGRAR
eukprot:14666987-Alexandrium_andersonii.AAC.1